MVELVRTASNLPTHQELEHLLETLRGCGRQVSFRAEVANTMNLTRLVNSGCLMLHYAGHGNGEYLAFESTTEWMCGIMEPLKVEYLENLFRVGGIVQTQLVFIGSCSSEVSGNVFVAAGVPHVVAVKHNSGVTDGAAREFATVFYDALIKHEVTVKRAFDTALICINAHRCPPKHEEDLFLLLPKGEEKSFGCCTAERLRLGRFQHAPFQEDQPFVVEHVGGKLVDETRQVPPRPPCKKAVSSYMGLVRVQFVVRLLLDPQTVCVTVTGEPGSGKTELAIQACDYVRERHHFDSFLWADCDKAALDACPETFFVIPNSPNGASGDSVSLEDLCRLIGVAIGMPQPGPSTANELHQFIFKNPNTDSGQPFQKVLLVLDNVDSLFERDEDAQDRLVHLLSDLCSMGGGGHLKLLATSEYKLLRGNGYFRGGSEMVATVKPLKMQHASELLMDNSPRDLQPEELGLQSGGFSKADVVSAVENHPVLKEVLKIAGGHPGTLVRLAPVLLHGSLNDARKLKEVATKCRASFRDKSYRQRGHRRSGSCTSAGSSNVARELSEAGSSLGTSAPTSRSPHGSPAPATPSQRPAMGNAFSEDAGHRRDRRCVSLNRTNSSIDGSGGGGGGAAAAWGTRPTRPSPPMPDEEDGGEGRPRPHSGNVGSHGSLERHDWLQSCVHQLSLERQDEVNGMHRRQMLAREALEEQPELPQMNTEMQHAWDMAEAARVERGSRLVWANATSYMVDDRRRNKGCGGGGWGVGGRLKLGEAVPLKYLLESLRWHLDVRMTVPCSSSSGGRHDPLEGTHYTYLDDGEEVDFEEVEADDHDAEDEEDQERAAGEGRRTGNRRMRPMRHATRVLDERQLGFIRSILRKNQKLAKAEANTQDSTACELDGLEDPISVGTFSRFSQWWTPLMVTLGNIRNDWARIWPIRVHGFIGRHEAQALLRMKPTAFLLRFSERHPGKLVVSRACHHHSLVEVTEGGQCFMEVDKRGTRRKYESLHDLVTQNSLLRQLYPDIPKEQVFKGKAPAAPETETEGTPEAPRGNGYGWCATS
ncbi:unnamed protein product [Ectocarpus sp. CCAP 1310/34]|nr:unnamed protein product [Ectocarpus sp. CCAP 1310/34]